ncbi:hypothetical protein Tco_0749637 [Tanacetum coccineum]|uniref:Uncharacterized protein n=1 Tax=Tanacetum coccineum TaxID=301880 RepID=A0ABQ4Z0A9_9ASTR
MNFLLESLMARIKEQVKDQLPQILPQEVPNFAPPVIENLIKESRDEVTLAKVSSQPQSTYEAASTLTEFELKKILLDKMDKDEDPFPGSDRGLKKRKTSKDTEPTTGPKKKDSTSGSSKGTKSQPKSTGKSVQSEEPVDETASRRDWFKKPKPPQEPNNPDWNVGKTTKEELEYDYEECYKALSEKLDWENPEGDDYLFDLSKPIPLITRGNRQRDFHGGLGLLGSGVKGKDRLRECDTVLS